MQILAKCPRCDAALPVVLHDGSLTIQCGRCQSGIPLAVSEAVRQDQGVDVCPVCRGADFYARKDFDPKIGVGVVSIGALISATFYWFGRDFVAYGVLAAAALVDLLVYGRLKEVTVCYRCHSEFRGAYERSARAFDLHTADVLEQEYEKNRPPVNVNTGSR